MQPSFESEPLAFAAVPHMRFDTIAVWFTRPAGLVVQLVAPTRMKLGHVNWLVGDVYGELLRRFPREKRVIVLDLSLMVSRTLASRTLFLAHARKSAQRFCSAYFVTPRFTTPASARSVQVSTALIRSFGLDVHIAGSASEGIAAAGVHSVP